MFNAELLMPLPGFEKAVRLGPFFDVGNVFTNTYTYTTLTGNRVTVNGYTFANEGVAMSTGLTVAWISPLGPLKFSYGQPINEVKTAKLQKFQFQMGTTF